MNFVDHGMASHWPVNIHHLLGRVAVGGDFGYGGAGAVMASKQKQTEAWNQVMLQCSDWSILLILASHWSDAGPGVRLPRAAALGPEDLHEDERDRLGRGSQRRGRGLPAQRLL